MKLVLSLISFICAVILIIFCYCSNRYTRTDLTSEEMCEDPRNIKTGECHEWINNHCRVGFINDKDACVIRNNKSHLILGFISLILLILSGILVLMGYSQNNNNFSYKINE